MTESMTHSISKARNEDGDFAMARVFATPKALDTPGMTRTDTSSKTSVKMEGDATADADASATANVSDSGMSAATFGETSVAVQ
jgi:hypothetical protein